MERLLTNKLASLTDLREPNKVIEEAGNQPIAIMNRNNLAGYFVPASAVEKISFEPADHGELMEAFDARKPEIQSTLDYLRDK